MREVAYLCGGGGGRQNLTKYNNALLSVIKIVKYYKVGRGGHWGGGRQNATKILAPSSSLSIKWLSIVTSGEGGERQNPTKDNGAPSVCH